MKSDYEVLGLEEGADEKEVKRAYFKLVRQFTPEKDPERFQEIRVAYENLKSGKVKRQLELKIPGEPLAEKMMEQIQRLCAQGDYWEAQETAQEAVERFGEWEGFLYYLALTQRKNYYSGKSVKSFEKLVKMNPDQVEFAREMAFSYLERGYGKKAYAAFGRAYEMGCRDIEFLDSYARNCRERKDYPRGISLLFEVVEAGCADRKEYMLNILDAYAGLFILSTEAGGERIGEVRDSLEAFLETAVPYMPDYTEDLENLMRSAMYAFGSLKCAEDDFVEKTRGSLKKGLGTKKADELWDSVTADMEDIFVSRDSRLSETMKYAYTSFVLDDYGGEEVSRFARLDSQLCILEEWPGIQAEVEIIQREYPIFYEALREYLDTLAQTKSIDVLREKLKKSYDRLAQYISGGRYYQEYPQYRREEKVIAEGGFGSDPYVRMQPKVGRNDPCPCGSGKKYKKCCGRSV